MYYCHLNSPWFQLAGIGKVKTGDSSEESKSFQEDVCLVMLWSFGFILLQCVCQSHDAAQEHLVYEQIQEGERQPAGDNNEKYFSREAEIKSEASRQIYTN